MKIIQLLKKIVKYILQIDNRKWGVERRQYEGKGDVLFINGCELAHPVRYRVDHQMEQLQQMGRVCHKIYVGQIRKSQIQSLVKNHNAIIIFRCPYRKNIGLLIENAKSSGRKVLFDVDDLVIDTKYTNLIPYVQALPEEEHKRYDENVNLMKKTLLMTDGAITSTECLAEELHHYLPEVIVNRNTASKEMVELSETALEKKKQNRVKQHVVRLGYFSGSITHNADVLLILPVIEKLMDKYSFLQLHIAGELDIPNELKAFEQRVEAHPFVNWKELPQLIGSVDINLCPLEQSIFNEAKSENKWIEASLMKIPTIASDIGAFTSMIEDGRTGFLCTNQKEWYQKLSVLIESEELRQQVAEQAYQTVHEQCVTMKTGRVLCDYLN